MSNSTSELIRSSLAVSKTTGGDPPVWVVVAYNVFPTKLDQYLGRGFIGGRHNERANGDGSHNRKKNGRYLRLVLEDDIEKIPEGTLRILLAVHAVTSLMVLLHQSA